MDFPQALSRDASVCAGRDGEGGAGDLRVSPSTVISTEGERGELDMVKDRQMGRNRGLVGYETLGVVDPSLRGVAH